MNEKEPQGESKMKFLGLFVLVTSVLSFVAADQNKLNIMLTTVESWASANVRSV